jgi:TonB-linked SusC/RagA family outer membrane protein
MKKNKPMGYFLERKWLKTLLKMKILAILIMALAYSATAKTYSQNQRVSIEVEQASILEVLNEIKEQTGLHFIYKKGLFDDFGTINIEVENEEVKLVLDQLLREKGLECEVEDEVITFKEIIKPVEVKKEQEKKELKGTVTDADGNTLPGVSVVVKGTTNGVATNIDGQYSIILEKSNAVLVFSFVGMISQEIAYTGKSTLDVELLANSKQMNEVIVTGYQNIARKRMTGSVDVVTAAKLADKGYLSVNEAIKGQMVGVSTMQLSGRPGASAQIRIRGMNTLTGNAEPIWIVDGMPMQGNMPKIGVGGSDFTNSVLTNGIGNISVDDIESITVLKDAAASAIYGSRAANGVIIITTKRGRAGKSYLNIRSSASIIEAPDNNVEMMNTKQKIAYETSLYNDFSHMNLEGRIFQLLKKRDLGIISVEEAEAEIGALSKINTNWYDKMFKTAYSQNHSISLQGGDEKTQFYGSLNYQNEVGIVSNNEYSNYGGTLKLTHNFNDKLRINFDVNINYKEDKTTASSINPLSYAMYANTYERPYDENENVVYDRSYSPTISKISPGYRYDLNALEDIKNNTNKTNYLNSGLNLKLEYEFIKGIMFASQASLSTTYSNGRKVLLPGTYSSERNSWINSIYNLGEVPDELNNGSLRETSSKSLSYTWRNTFSFDKYITNDHYISVMMGQEISNSESNSFFNLSPEYDPLYELVGVPNLSNIDGSKLEVRNLGGTSSSQNRSVSFFSTATYSYKDKYVISGSGRFDGVDIVGTDNRFTPLWNASLKYNIYNEGFMKDVEWVNVLSIRASLGYTASIDYGANPFPILRFDSSSRRYDDRIVPSNVSSANPSIKWQKKQDRNLGLDYSLFNNRFSGTINYYNNITRNLLDTKKVPFSTGRPIIKANVASLRNEGLEISFNTVNLKLKDFRWTTSFNITFNKNRVLDTHYKGLDDLPTITRSIAGVNQYFIQGNPTQAWYGYKSAGVDSTNGHSLAYINVKDEDGNPVGHQLDNGRYVIDMDQEDPTNGSANTSEFRNDAVQFLGDAYPTFSGGWGTGFTYKRLSLRAMFTFMGGHKIKSARNSSGNPILNSRLNASVNVLNRWRKNGDITDVPEFSTYSSNAYNKYFFDYDLEDGDFVKLSNLSLTYNLPSSVCKKLNLTRTTIGLSANNLYTWTKYKGIDPENMGAFGYPSARRFSFNLNIGI